MGQAQRLLDEANKQAELHAAMQCKQRDEQKAIIIKHEVNDSFFFHFIISSTSYNLFACYFNVDRDD